MHMIMEDDPDMPISKMLERVLCISFTKGNDRLGKIVQRNNSEYLIILVDSVPDNDKTNDIVNMWRRKTSRVGGDNKYNIYFPIPCIEYYIIFHLKRLGFNFKVKFDWLDKVVDNVLKLKTTRNLPDKRVYKYRGNTHTFEKQCKFVLSNIGDMFLNTVTENLFESYYLNDYSINGKIITSIDKAISVASEFPVAIFNSKNCLNKSSMIEISFEELLNF